MSLNVARRSSLSTSSVYHSCVEDNSSDKQYQDSVYSSYSAEREEPAAEPEPITKAHYEQLRCSLGDRPRLEPPNVRSDAREKLARLTRVQFLELAMDVHDEITREKGRNSGDFYALSTLPVRSNYTSQRNEARQKIAELRSDLLQELMSDIFYELGRRYPRFKEAGSPSEKVSLFQYTSGPVESELASGHRLSRIVVEHKTLEDNIGKIVRSMTLELNNPSTDIISSSMSITEIISILGQHGCPDITDALDVGRCGLGPVAGGGFGDVYQGCLRTGVEVAIKCPRFFVNRAEISRADLKAAARELHAWSKYNHPNVVQLLGVAQFRDRMAMISPWMKNGTLCQYILRYPNADKYSLVHGDIKGLNILVSQDGSAKLIDFGNSRLKTSTLRFTGSHTAATFSTRWTAPELLNGSEAYTPEADVYALGMTILEVVSGQLPFSDLRNDPAIITRVVVQKQYPERPIDSFPLTRQGDALWKLLTQCWSFDPSARPRASEIQTQLMPRGVAYQNAPLAATTNSSGENPLDVAYRNLTLSAGVESLPQKPETIVKERRSEPHHPIERSLPPDPLTYRLDARNAIASLTPVEFLEFMTDVHEVITRLGIHKDNSVSVPDYLLVGNQYSPQRYEVQRRLAELHPDALKAVVADVFHELGRRYPTLKKMERMSKLAIASPPSPNPSVLENMRSRACSHISMNRNIIGGNPGGVVSTRGIEPNSTDRSGDIVSSKMVCTHGILARIVET
ncbi:hypothetical protein FRC07_004499 [Ceratobasidium sp. 392]|nr:hypothetical protein FRC07_004499 [Ceratobasidium sp. 392]